METRPASTVESRLLCKACGGACCKSGPCSYAPSDFASDHGDREKAIIGRIALGHAVIDAKDSFWFVRAPAAGEEGQVAIYRSDCIEEAPCALLGEEGCVLADDERPLLGKMIMPSVRGGEVVCDYPREETVRAIQEWASLQKTLRSIVGKYA